MRGFQTLKYNKHLCLTLSVVIGQSLKRLVYPNSLYLAYILKNRVEYILSFSSLAICHLVHSCHHFCLKQSSSWQ